MKVTEANQPFSPVKIHIESREELETLVDILVFGKRKRPKQLRQLANDLSERLRDILLK
jgi:hypothetical protein